MSDFNRSRWVDWTLRLYLLLAFAFIFAPIAASFVFSFNVDRFPSLPLGGFSTTWYEAVAADPLVWEGLRNTLLSGLIVSVLATAIGFGAAYMDFRYKFFGKPVYVALALLPPTIPVVILGLAMLAFLSSVNLSDAIHSVIIAHVVMCAPFAMAIIRLRLSQMNPSLETARGISARPNGRRCATSSFRSPSPPFSPPCSSPWRCPSMSSSSPGSCPA